MSKNAKLEFFIVRLNAIDNAESYTFRDFFKDYYITKKELVNTDIESVSTIDLQSTFFENMVDLNNDKYKLYEKKRKGFNFVNDRNNPAYVKLDVNEHTIRGLVKGGNFDTGKEHGNVKNSKKKEKLERDSILLDDFYFLLYHPLKSREGILILQSYTDDQIGDIFKPFIEKLFKIPGKTNQAYIKKFMPLEMQNKFKEGAVLDKFSFVNKEIIKYVDGEVYDYEDLKIQVVITTGKKGDKSLNAMPKLRKMLNSIGISIPGSDGNQVKTLNNFEHQTGYLSNSSMPGSSPFALDDEKLEINPTIYLKNKIDVEENGVPKWMSLDKYAIEVLNSIVKPEIYKKYK